MVVVHDETNPDTLQAIRKIVLILARGEQPSREMDLLPAIDCDYAECKPYREEGGYPGLVLTAKGLAAAAVWLAAN